MASSHLRTTSVSYCKVIDWFPVPLRAVATVWGTGRGLKPPIINSSQQMGLRSEPFFLHRNDIRWPSAFPLKYKMYWTDSFDTTQGWWTSYESASWLRHMPKENAFATPLPPVVFRTSNVGAGGRTMNIGAIFLWKTNAGCMHKQ